MKKIAFLLAISIIPFSFILKEDSNVMDSSPFLGKKLLVGVRFVDESDCELGTFQTHGKIVRISETEGVVISKTWSGKEFRLPPDSDALTKVDPGIYKLRNGEVVVDPDYTTVWKVIMNDGYTESLIDEYKEHGYTSPPE